MAPIWEKLRNVTAPFVALALLGTGCRPNVIPSTEYGYIVLGYRGRALFDLPGDTVPELRRSAVPRAISDGGVRFANGWGHDPLCNRFFKEGTRFLLLTRVTCAFNVKITEGGLALTRLDSAGNVVGPTVGWNSNQTIYAIVPYFRGSPLPD